MARRYGERKTKIGKGGENRYRFTKTKDSKKIEREIPLIQRKLANTILILVKSQENNYIFLNIIWIWTRDLIAKGSNSKGNRILIPRGGPTVIKAFYSSTRN